MNCKILRPRAVSPAVFTGLLAVGMTILATLFGPTHAAAEPAVLPLPGEIAAAQGVMAAELQLARGDTAAGLRAYLAVLQRYPEAGLAIRVTQLAAAGDLPSVMLPAAQRWAALAPTDAAAGRAVLEAQLRLGQWPAVAKALERRVSTTPVAQQGEALDAALLWLSEQNESVAAAQVAAQMAARWPQRAEGWAGLAQVASGAGLVPAARAALVRLVSLRPLNAEEDFFRVRLLAAEGDFAAALAALGPPLTDEALGKRVLRAQLLVSAQDLPAARALLKEMLEAPRLRVFALRLLAGMELQAQRFDEAARLYGELEAVSSKEPDGTLGLAAVAEARGDLDAALLRYLRVQRGPSALASQLMVWRLRRQRGQPQVAAADFDHFLAENPDFRAEGLSNRATWLVRQGAVAEGLALLDAAAGAYPEHRGVLQARANALEAAGRTTESLRWYAAAAAARRWDPEALNNYAYQLAVVGRQLPLAERLARQATAARPVAASWDTLGWVLFRRGQTAEARVWLEKALARQSEPEIAAHLGEVLWAMGQKAQAEAIWRAGLIGAEPEALRELRATALRVAGLSL